MKKSKLFLRLEACVVYLAVVMVVLFLQTQSRIDSTDRRLERQRVNVVHDLQDFAGKETATDFRVRALQQWAVYYSQTPEMSFMNADPVKPVYQFACPPENCSGDTSRLWSESGYYHY